ncbi:MAG: hypothetical protein M2R45_01243 [Verrucomicrobia subdivision 3 bacterium]|nr:hypothetical protein [Limisphaerales bacterium]MCS1415114.1 hypothetical protein [Limisphaerales bacterium]
MPLPKSLEHLVGTCLGGIDSAVAGFVVDAGRREFLGEMNCSVDFRIRDYACGDEAVAFYVCMKTGDHGGRMGRRSFKKIRMRWDGSVWALIFNRSWH